MLFLIPLAEAAVEGAVVLAESTAVRTALVEAGQALVSNETRQAITSLITNEGRSLASSLASAEGRQALVDAVAEGASNLAAKGGEAWRAARAALGSEGEAQVLRTVKDFGFTVAKAEARNEAIAYGADKAIDVAQELITAKALGFFAEAADSKDVEAFSKSAAAYGSQVNLAGDLQRLASELGHSEKSEQALAELSGNLAAAQALFPEKGAQLEALHARTDAISNLQIAELKANTELKLGGAVSAETLGTLREAIQDLATHGDAKTQQALAGALDSLKTGGMEHHSEALRDVLSEVSVAEHKALQGLSQETVHLCAEVSHAASQQKEEMGQTLDSLMPAIVAKNDQEHARAQAQDHTAEQAHEPAYLDMMP